MSFLEDWSRRKRPFETVPLVQESEGEEESSENVSKTPIIDPYVKKIYNNTYRNKHKGRLNMFRRRYDQTPQGAFKKARRKARYKGQKWDLSFDNWWMVWAACPQIFDDERGIYRYAWDMRGNDPQKNTQMRRKDTSKAWMVSNVEVIYRNQSIPEHGIVAPWDWKRNKPTMIVGQGASDDELE